MEHNRIDGVPKRNLGGSVHEFIDSPDDIIALQVSQKITGNDLQMIMDRLDGVMARHNKVHVFVETHSIDGIEVSSLPSYMTRAMPLFGKLSCFGRVAVVADQAWVRVGTRLESALLPNIRYRTYMPEERDEALAWVVGDTR
jgi:hypothetical protein